LDTTVQLTISAIHKLQRKVRQIMEIFNIFAQ